MISPLRFGPKIPPKAGKEGKVYVSYAKELDVSSCGKSIREAKKNLIEAVECFLETAEEMGTLEERKSYDQKGI